MPSIGLLHGFTGAPASWVAVRMHLDRSIEINCPTLLGHGDDAPKTGESFEQEADRLAELVAPGGRVDVLCGYSLGARLALTLALRHPERVGRLVLVGVHPGLEEEEARKERRHADASWISKLEGEGIEGFVDAWEQLPLFSDDQLLLTASQRMVQRRIRLSHDPAGLAASLRVCGLAEMPPTPSRLSGLGLPVRLVVGGNDTKFRALAREMAKRLPRAETTTIPTCGHGVPMLRPVTLAAILDEELQRRTR